MKIYLVILKKRQKGNKIEIHETALTEDDGPSVNYVYNNDASATRNISWTLGPFLFDPNFNICFRF